MNYQDGIKKHLSDYKIPYLGIKEDGTWRGRQYPHILPSEHYKLNILGTIRDQFWNYYESGESGLNQKRHINFHHLNSSQAMCFNLFFPFIMENYRYLTILLDTLKLPKENVSEVSFEKVINAEEGTNFDFYIKYYNGMQVLFEVKFSENGFGSARNDQRHREKYNSIYKKLIENVISKKFQAHSLFFKHYQLIRNLAYLGEGEQNNLYFIYPIENRSLDRKVDQLLPAILERRFEDRVNVGHIENIISALVSRCEDQNHQLLKKHFEWFIRKYIILSNSLGYKNSRYTWDLYKRYKGKIWK